MRPKTKLPIPEPSGLEFQNFDRLTGILLSKVRAPKKKRDKPADRDQGGQRRLPRP